MSGPTRVDALLKTLSKDGGRPWKHSMTTVAGEQRAGLRKRAWQHVWGITKKRSVSCAGLVIAAK